MFTITYENLIEIYSAIFEKKHFIFEKNDSNFELNDSLRIRIFKFIIEN